jgi:hypothetical protein
MKCNVSQQNPAATAVPCSSKIHFDVPFLRQALLCGSSQEVSPSKFCVHSLLHVTSSFHPTILHLIVLLT